MEHEASIRPGPRDLLLRALAVAFAVAAGCYLIVAQHRGAQPAPDARPPALDAPAAPSDGAEDGLDRLSAQGAPDALLGPVEALPPTYGFSSKSLSFTPSEAPPTAPPQAGSGRFYMPSSKSDAGPFLLPSLAKPASDAGADDAPAARSRP
jgi:hypothetical protein